MKLRLQKFLGNAGIASRRNAEELIKQGSVKVNGKRAVLGDSIDMEHDIVTVKGKYVDPPETPIYVALYKPRKYVTTREDQYAKRTVFDLLPKEFKKKLWPVGRLDADTEGLLLLTNDGDLTQALTHPGYAHEKEYELTLETMPTAKQLRDLRHGVSIKGRITEPARAVIRGKKVYVTLTEGNVGLAIDFSNVGRYRVYGRGEMHIAILLENMRREGFEIQVSQPHVITKEEDGKTLEPFEEVTIDVPESYSGTIIEKLAKRKGQMKHMDSKAGQVRMLFDIPTRGLLGYRGDFIVDTKGEGILSSQVIGFKQHVGTIEKHDTGSMVSMTTGKALGFALFNLQDRGSLYIGPNTEVYEGMVIGNSAKGFDMGVNPTKGKQLTNMRSSGADEAINLTPPIELTIERGLEIMHDDEYLEVTPKHIRIRKQILNESERLKAQKKK